MTIDKFDPNPILVNINKLKPYRFVEDQTFQPILARPSDFLPEKMVKTNHFGNMFTKELVETNHSSNVFIEELVKLHTKDLTLNNLLEKKTNYNLAN
jgi:hypothetical protein